METVRNFIILAIFIVLSIGCIMNMVRHHKEEKAAKEEKKRKRSPFAQQRANEAELESMESLMEDKALEGDGSGEDA